MIMPKIGLVMGCFVLGGFLQVSSRCFMVL